MIPRLNPRPTFRRRRRLGIVCGGLCLPLFLIVAGTAGYRVNLTASEPLGIWRIRSLDRPPRIGDVVFICPPQRRDMALAAQHGYLRSGLCCGGFAPLIKMVAAVGGQWVEIGRTVTIDHLPLPHSAIVAIDGKERPLTPFAGGQVQAGSVYLHSNFLGSYDSRYFGPVPASGILGLAQEVLTFAS
ncbi:MAG: conjugative transfer signal peptidase TraF [Pseudorhizobium sp.]